MKALIVYDSVYGNTEKIAGAIAGAITGEVKVLRAVEVNPSEVFIVNSREGPMKDGELDRAAGWAKGVVESRK